MGICKYCFCFQEYNLRAQIYRNKTSCKNSSVKIAEVIYKLKNSMYICQNCYRINERPSAYSPKRELQKN